MLGNNRLKVIIYIVSKSHMMVGLTPKPSSMLTPRRIDRVPLRHKLKDSLVRTQFIDTL